jgi:MFS family permease
MPSAKGLRFVAFACALLLSVGAHYGRELLGPLKSQLMARFGGNNLQFSLLFSAYTLSSTVTPLLTPLLASKIGMAWTSVLATATILLGQSIVSVSSIFNVQLGLLVGMLTFGLAVSPVALCSEYIIIRFFKVRRCLGGHLHCRSLS